MQIYGVATVSRIDKIIGLFCRISSVSSGSHVYVYLCMYMSMDTYMYLHVHLYVHIFYLFVCVFICVFTCVFICEFYVYQTRKRETLRRLCRYLCIRAYLCLSIYVHVHEYLYGFTCISICTYLYVFICLCLSTYVHVHEHSYIFPCTSICTCVNVFICVFIRVFTCMLMCEFYIYVSERWKGRRFAGRVARVAGRGRHARWCHPHGRSCSTCGAGRLLR